MFILNNLDTGTSKKVFVTRRGNMKPKFKEGQRVRVKDVGLSDFPKDVNREVFTIRSIAENSSHKYQYNMKEFPDSSFFEPELSAIPPTVFDIARQEKRHA